MDIIQVLIFIVIIVVAIVQQISKAGKEKKTPSPKEVLADMYPEKLELNKLWNEALDYAGSKFDSLPVSKKLNGFYLQELMHRYVELLGNVVTENKEN